MYASHRQFSRTRQTGYLLVLVLVFGSIFLVIIASFVGFVVTQSQVVNFRFEQQRATDIAEAGLNYYKWYLAHYPDDFTNGTGLPGPYVHEFRDPEGEAIGEFSLEIASSTYCGDVASIEIESTGYTYNDPSAPAVVSARYKRPTVAEYSFITNAGVWYGASSVVVGPLHSNQGFRMDATHNSTVGSGQTSWTCDSSYGCSPDQVVDGVYASPSSNATPGLFQFPVSPIDFAGITFDLADMRDKAINNGGIHYGPSGGFGYLVTFNGDDTVTVERVTNTYNYYSYSSAEGYHWGERNVITGTSSPATETIDDACPLLFFEDKVWVEGFVNQKVTMAASNLGDSTPINVVLEGDLEYVPGNDAGLLVIAEDDLDIGVQVPNDMTIEGIFIAQNGRFGRNYYSTSWFNGANDQYVTRDSLTRLGTIVTNTRAVTRWTSGGVTLSGFEMSNASFDLNQVDSPPPLTPETSDVYDFDNWRQEG